MFREIDSTDQNDYYENWWADHLRYPGDVALLSRSAKGLNNIIQKDKAVSEQYGLRINGKKTKVLKTDKTEAR